MKNRIFNLFILFGVLLIGIVIAHTEQYAFGEIIVNFQNNASEKEINSLIDSYNLSWKKGYPLFVEKNNFTIYAELSEDIMKNSSLKNNISKEIISKDKEIYSSNYILVGAWPISFVYLDKYNKSLMVVAFNNRATEQKARELLDNFEELKIKEIVMSEPSSGIIHKWGVVKVPEGKEQIWIKIFEKEPIVDSVSLNYISETQDNVESFQGCVNKCGDNICDKIVCQGSGCPCSETPENCPIDCTSEKDEIQNKSNLIYWISGIIILIIFILILILKKKR